MKLRNDRDSRILRILSDIWINSFLGLKMSLYIIAILFLAVGIWAVFHEGMLLGIILMILNVLLILLFRKLDKKADDQFNRDFDEMIRKNRGE